MDLGKGIKDGGGYDLAEIERAEEALSNKVGDEKGFAVVEPIYIQVIEGGYVAREQEYEARSVIIEYDDYDNVVSVELL